MSYPKYGPAMKVPRRDFGQASFQRPQQAIQPIANAFAPQLTYGPQQVFEPSQDYGNVYQEAAKYRWNPDLLRIYEQAAFRAGLDFGASAVLHNLIMSDCTTIRTDTATHNTIPVSFNADVRSQVLEYHIDKPAFIRRVTGTVNAIVVHPEAVSGFEGAPIANTEPQALYEIPYDGGRAWDLIYGQWRIDGSARLLADQFVPLSVLMGTGIDSYFYDLIPALGHGTRLRLELTIDPPQNQAPAAESYFVSRIGVVSIQLHIEQFDLFG